MNENYEVLLNSFYKNRDQETGINMAKYLKNQFLCLGIKRPERSKLQKNFINQWKKKKILDWEFIHYLWELPEREFQYLAIDLLVALNNELKHEDIDKLERLIIKKSWWDTVDILSTKMVGKICELYPELIGNKIVKWSVSDNIWLVRSAILFQLKYKFKTDKFILAQIIESNLESEEFFVNKAIGWALREYSKTNPVWVKEFIESKPLHKLSVREGSKYINKI